MQSITVKSYTDNLYHPADDGKMVNVLFFEANHISSVTFDPNAGQLLQLLVWTAHETNFLQLTYDELKGITPLMEDLARKFKERKVVVSNRNVTLVPEPLLNVIETEIYHKLNHHLLPNSQVLYCKQHILNTAAVFNVRNELIKLIRFNMPMVDVVHSSLLFLKAIAHQQFSESANKLHLQVHPGYIEIANLNSNSLQFFNTYSFQTETEIVYFLLAAAEHLQISHTCDVILYGNSPMLNELNHLIAKYVRSVQYAIKPKNFTYPASFKEFAEHQLFTEASALLCE